MTLHDCFERVVVLNLPENAERRRKLEANMRETGIADPAKVVWSRAFSGDLMPPPAWWNAGDGAWGCCFSHVATLATGVMDRLESVLILEDDAVFCVDACEFLGELWGEWPERWGQIYLGGQHIGPDPVRVGTKWLRGHNINRNHAYAVHRNTMSQMVAHCLHAPDYMQHPGGWHIDHQLGTAHERQDWDVFAPRYWLAGQSAGLSNISGGNNRERWWQPVPTTMEVPLVLLPAFLTNDDPVYRDYCHAGNNLLRDTCEDVGVNGSLSLSGGVARFLSLIRGEAVWHHRLPAVQHSGYNEEMLQNIWKGVIIRYPTGHELAELHRQTQKNIYRAVLQ